jgi:hypothetical protein
MEGQKDRRKEEEEKKTNLSKRHVVSFGVRENSGAAQGFKTFVHNLGVMGSEYSMYERGALRDPG